MGAIIRVLLGFILACIAAGATKVLFAVTPNEILNADADLQSRALDWVLLTATHSAVFSAPFALVAAAIGEWQNIRSWTYYAIAGIAIAVAGFIAQHMSEDSTAPSIVNNYALTAFLTTGFVAGLVYWLVAGRKAGDEDYEVTATAASRTASRPTAGTGSSTPRKA